MKNKFSFSDRIKSFKFALKGIYSLFLYEHNARIHLVCGICSIVLGFFLKLSNLEWVAILLCIALVLIAEIFNTAIERLCDFVEPQRNEQIGLIKDYAAGGVLIASITAFVIGMIVFVPKFYSILVL